MRILEMVMTAHRHQLSTYFVTAAVLATMLEEQVQHAEQVRQQGNKQDNRRRTSAPQHLEPTLQRRIPRLWICLNYVPTEARGDLQRHSSHSCQPSV